MSKAKTFFTEPIGELIHGYSRKQALEDKALVDVSEAAREAGFRVPVAMTAAAWSNFVEWTDADSQRQTYQDMDGRLWDVLWMCIIASRRAKGSSGLCYQFYSVPRDGFSITPKLMSLKVLIGPGDSAEPVITILLPDED